MFNKKVLSILLIMLLNMTFLVGCSIEIKDMVHKSNELNIKLLLPGTLEDNSINDLASTGVNKIKNEFGDRVNIEVIEMGFDETKFESLLLDTVKSDADIIITGQLSMKKHIEYIAQLYPNKKFLLYDTEVDYYKYDLENVYSITYKQNEAGFLSGVLAALITKSDMEFANEESSIGFIGATKESEIINDFLVGYIEGAKFIDKDIKVKIDYADSFTDIQRVKELTLNQYLNGVDIVFTAAGLASKGSIEAALDSKKYVIGVDRDQALVYEGREEQKHIVSSVLKRVDNSIALVMESFFKNSLQINNNINLGINEGVIELAQNDIYTSTVNEDIRNKVSEITKELKCGKIKIKSVLDMDEYELNKLINLVNFIK